MKLAFLVFLSYNVHKDSQFLKRFARITTPLMHEINVVTMYTKKYGLCTLMV